MAEGLARSRTNGVIEASSAGTASMIGGTVNNLSARVLAEVGADISRHRPRQLTDDLVQTADLVVSVGAAAAIPTPDGIAVEIWNTAEPSERGIDGLERMRLIRDDIAARVDDLARRLSARASQ
ncbi:low molecular weight phosphatase family protein [Gordonia sp. L191]|uniref:arsenate-mycothiol transferase ArsC n=1 Tax=Gordonia sp. L191 TaxID=2982699 RepID=UPI0024C0CDCB|nr:low molecular weight phosphatase family protein [Gordonia sp. L191]WHU50105.1 low molecular weight phosphatase family protein [Gordonia sp. L191]